MYILHAIEYLSQEVACLLLCEPALVDDVVEQFTIGSVFHYEVQLLGCLDDLALESYFVQLDDVGVSDQLHYVDFTGYSEGKSPTTQRQQSL